MRILIVTVSLSLIGLVGYYFSPKSGMKAIESAENSKVAEKLTSSGPPLRGLPEGRLMEFLLEENSSCFKSEASCHEISELAEFRCSDTSQEERKPTFEFWEKIFSTIKLGTKSERIFSNMVKICSPTSTGGLTAHLLLFRQLVKVGHYQQAQNILDHLSKAMPPANTGFVAEIVGKVSRKVSAMVPFHMGLNKQLLLLSTNWISPDSIKHVPFSFIKIWIIQAARVLIPIGLGNKFLERAINIDFEKTITDDPKGATTVSFYMCLVWRALGQPRSCQVQLSRFKNVQGPPALRNHINMEIAFNLVEDGKSRQAKEKLEVFAVRARRFNSENDIMWTSLYLAYANIALGLAVDARSNAKMYGQLAAKSDWEFPWEKKYAVPIEMAALRLQSKCKESLKMGELEKKWMHNNVLGGPTDIEIWIDMELLFCVALTNDKLKFNRLTQQIYKDIGKLPLIVLKKSYVQAIVDVFNGNSTNLDMDTTILGEKHPQILILKKGIEMLRTEREKRRKQENIL